MASKKAKKPAKIVSADVTFISLCFEGKTGIKGLYKAKGKDREVAIQHASKDLGEGRLLTVMYAPHQLDDDTEWADEAAIQTMIDSFAKNGGKIDVDHDGKAIDAYLVESFTIQEGDPRFKDFDGDVTGGWGGVLQIDDDEYKEKYSKEDWSGVSIGGDAMFVEGAAPIEKAKSSSIKKLVTRLLSSFNKSEEVTGLSMNIDLAPTGETDYLGNPKKDSFYVSLSGEILND